MLELLHTALRTALSFPTVVLTVLLGLALLYWLVSTLTGSEGALDGAAEGLVESAVEGAAEAALEGAAEAAAEGFAEAAADGLAEGIVEGAGDAAGEGLAESAESLSMLGRLLGCLGVGVVPVTLSISLVLLFAWLSSLVLTHLLGRHVDFATSGLLIGFGVLALAVGLGVVAATVAVRPLKPLFGDDQIVTRRDLVGRECTITTTRVNDGFGMAEVADGAAGLLLQVRSRAPLDGTRGVAARITQYDASDDVFYIEMVERENRAATPHGDGAAGPGAGSDSATT